MSWVHIARKDFADASRSMMLWALTALLILAVAGISAIPHLLATDGTTLAFEEAVGFLFSPIGFLIPIIGLVVGYQAIVSERESGSIRFLLGLPNTRGDVVLGKVLGRTGVVAIPTVIGFAVGAVVIVALYDGFVVAEFLGLLAFSLLMGLVYVAIAIGISASVSSRAKALAATVVFFVLFDVAWEFVAMAMYWASEGSLPGFDGLPAWYLFVVRLSPGQALSAISLTLVDFVGAGDIDLTAAGRVAGEVPFYLENWFAWIIVALWIVVPLGIGYVRFENAVLS